MKPPHQTSMIAHKYSHIYVTERPRCPVCNKDAYSAAGIHPQCAAERHETEHRAEQKRIRREAERVARAEALLAEG